MTSRSTVIYVAYGVETLDLRWIPHDTAVIVVHNDERLPEAACGHASVHHIHTGSNVGFGAGMNRALGSVFTPRVILCNPDTGLTRAHFDALDDGDDHTIVTIPLVEADGVPNAVVNPYWTVPAFLATAWRLGRFAPRGGRRIEKVMPLLGPWGRGHRDSLTHRPGEWPVSERWVAGAVLSLPTEAICRVGGFDEEYFLYFEDADLHQRLARSHPELKIRLADIEPAHHAVGGSAVDPADSLDVARHRRRSARTYASRQPGVSWRVAESMLSLGTP